VVRNFRAKEKTAIRREIRPIYEQLGIIKPLVQPVEESAAPG